MPEYLSPGVYIKEIEIGAKPVEGVSTSTAGFVGMTERGPLNKPTLVTSFAEYEMIFGGYLDGEEYVNKCYRYLPYSVEGFFSNGGQRLYVNRVAKMADPNRTDQTDFAVKSNGFLPDVSGQTTTLDADAEPRSITLKVTDTTGLSDGDILFLKDGPQSELLTYKSPAKALTVNLPLSGSYVKGTEIVKMNEAPEVFHMKEDVVESPKESNEAKIILEDATTPENMAKLIPDNMITIIDGEKSEICKIISKGTSNGKWITVSPLRYGHSKASDLKILAPSAKKTQIISNVKQDSNVIPITNTDTDFESGIYFNIGNDYLIIQETDKDKVILIDTEHSLKYKHKQNTPIKRLIKAICIEAANEGKWGDRIKIVISESSITKTKLKNAVSNEDFLELETVFGIEKGTLLKIGSEYKTVNEVIKTEDTSKVILDNRVNASFSKDTEVSTIEFDLTVKFDSMEEVFKNLSMNPSHSRYFENIITKDTSQLIRVKDARKDANPSDKRLMPTEDKIPAWKLSGGRDGIPGDVDLFGVYKGTENIEPERRTGLQTLMNIDDISIVAMPGITTQELQNQLIVHCDNMRNRFAVLDSIGNADLNQVQNQRILHDSKFAALYYPWIRVFDPVSKKPINVPPSGHICGIYARSDNERGVHKAPANEVVNGALDLEEIPESGTKRIITKGQQDILNPKGINCIRVFPGRGIRVWGARTISSDSLWKYVNVRRLFIYIEESIYKGTQWAVFEPNNEMLWGRVKATIDEFLTRVWRDGALMGLKADEAFFIKCDRSTMTQDDIDNGRLICIIGIAPVKPAEFVVFRIAQWAGGSAAKE